MPRRGHPLNCLGTKLGERGMSLAGQRGEVEKLSYSDVMEGLWSAERSGLMPASALLTDIPPKAGLNPPPLAESGLVLSFTAKISCQILHIYFSKHIKFKTFPSPWLQYL